MRRNAFLAIACSWALVSAAQADWITSWGQGTSNPPSPDFAIDQFAGTITILHGNGLNYKFYSETFFQSDVPGSINNITIDPGATGDFTILIDHRTPDNPSTNDPDDAGWHYGALHWKAGILTYAGGTCTVVGIQLRGNLCANATTFADILCGKISGNIGNGKVIQVLGKLSLDSGNGLGAKLRATEIYGDIELGSMFGDIETGALYGNVLVHDAPVTTKGDISVGSGYDGTMVFEDPPPYGCTGRIKIAGDFRGDITYDGPYFGAIEITGDMIAPARILFNSYVSRAEGDRPPNVRVRGSITNPDMVIGSAPLIEVLGEGSDGLRGTIAIDGRLDNAVTNGPEIKVADIQAGARGAITIDYDGWDSADNWDCTGHDPNNPDPHNNCATVEEWHDDQLYRKYSGNDPTHSVFRTTSCKGDLNNDGIVDILDVQAINEARLMYLPIARDCFVDHYPGREGSVPWHGDLDADAVHAVTCIDFHWLEHLVNGDTFNCCTTDYALLLICRADFDHDGSVGASDLTAFLSHYGQDETQPGWDKTYDFNFGDCSGVNTQFCNGIGATDTQNAVDVNDFTLFLSVFGSLCPCYSTGLSGGFGDGMSAPVGGDEMDPDFVTWVRQASVDELLAWYDQWLSEHP